MTRLKSRRLRSGKQARESELDREADRLLLAAISSGNRGVMPLFDWRELNEAKLLYCHHCRHFGMVLGGCRFNLLPSKKCERFRDDGSSDGVKKSGIKFPIQDIREVRSDR